MRLKATILAALGLVLLVGAGAWFFFVHAPVPPQPPLSGRLEEATLRVGDRDRSYLSYVPAGLPRGAPLVIVLHGTSMDAKTMGAWTGYEFDALADARGFAVAYPDGYGKSWNDCRKKDSTPAKREQIDDVDFLGALIAHFEGACGTEPGKVFAFGYSNGGQMAMRLAFDAPRKLAAVALAGTNLPVAENNVCPTQGPTPRVLLVSGTADPISPFAGGEVTIFGLARRGFVLSADATAELLAARNGLPAAPATRVLPHSRPDDPTSVELRTWLKDGRPFIEEYRVIGGGHVVPQPKFRFPRILGRVTSDLDAPAQAVRFFLE